MRRIGDLWAKVCSKESLYQAYLAARKGKRRHHSCHNFERRLGAQIDGLYEELATGSYRPHPPNSFFVYEPKKRLIEAPAFRDLVVQHALYAQIMPIFERRFVPTNFACRVGLGTHKAADHVQKMLAQSESTSWILKVDCRKFFYSINHDVLISQIRRVIKCERTCQLAQLFVHRPEGVGVPIGNLMSQVFGLLYLNDLDHFIKRTLKIKWHARYVDDSVMVLSTRNEAVSAFESIKEFLRDRLKLGVSKHSIEPIKKGVNCFGYRTWASRRFIRKRSLYIAAKRIKAGDLQAFISCLGHAKKTSSLNYLLNLARKENAYLSLPKSFRPVHHLRPAGQTGST